MTIAEQLRQEGMQKGLHKGMHKGMKKGVQKGIQKGLHKGRQEERSEIARNLLSMGLDRDAIVRATGMTCSEINALPDAEMSKGC